MKKPELTPEKHEKIEKILLRITSVVGIVLVILCAVILIQFFLSVVFGYDIPSQRSKSSTPPREVTLEELSMCVEEFEEPIDVVWQGEIVGFMSSGACYAIRKITAEDSYPYDIPKFMACLPGNDYTGIFYEGIVKITGKWTEMTDMYANAFFEGKCAPLVEVEEIVEVSPPRHSMSTGWNNQTRTINGNVFYRDQNLVEKQITFQNSDSNPILSPDGKKIAFFRKTPDNPIHGCWHDNSIIHEMWLYDLMSKEKELLVSGGNVYAGNLEELSRPGDMCKYILAHFVDLQFSLDSKTIYFSHAAWATSGAIQSVDVSTGEIKFVSSGNDGFEVIKDGEYKGDILIGSKHKYFYGGGSYDICFVVSPEGKELLAIVSKDDFYNGDYFKTSKQDRDNFFNYIENNFFNIKYVDSDIKGVKRIVEKDEDEGEKIFRYLTYPEEIEGEESLYSVGVYFRELVGDSEKSIIEDNFFDGSLISNDYEITLLKDSLLSIRFDFYEYSAGAVHGMYRTEVFNFKSCGNDCRGELIELEDLFKPDSDYLAVLSEISQNKIAEKFKENGDEDYYDADSAKSGTSPESGNLNKFNLSEDALIITFDPYEVAAYGFGKQTVEIPYEELEVYLDFDGIIKDLIKK